MVRMANQTDIIRKKLAVDILQNFLNGTLREKIDLLPITRHPKNRETIRCCVHKDRAITRYRILALLGADIEADDDIRQIHDYLEDALSRECAPKKPLTMIQDACRSCTAGEYVVTDMCQGCVARYCQSNCPKDAITIHNGKALINQEVCVNCGKCKTACPYNAVSYLPIPCEEACPVDAIKKNEYGLARIDEERCIACGRCMISCPFGAVELRSELMDVVSRIQNPDIHITAMIAPSIAGQFPGTVSQIVAALYQSGFDAVYEVAAGADITAANEAKELQEKIDARQILGTSCCPAYVQAVQKHVPEFLESVSHTPTPASCTAQVVKDTTPESITVFIGPCVAKKVERYNDHAIDYTLTYDELSSLFLAQDIDVLECEERTPQNAFSSRCARNFAVSHGVADAVLTYYPEKETQIRTEIINGLDKKNITRLKLIASGKIPCDLVEVMSCEGGCICGPGSSVNPRISQKKHAQYVSEGCDQTDACTTHVGTGAFS